MFIYDRHNTYYDVAATFQRNSITRGLNIAEVRDGDLVLEVGFGTGEALVELARKVGGGKVYGLDISPKALEKARALLARNSLLSKVQLNLGDARRLPYDNDFFDVLFSSYVLDLLESEHIPIVLSEFKRVMKPGGKVVLVNMSRYREDYGTTYDILYKNPSAVGGSRPVIVKPELERLGFRNIDRIYLVHDLMPFGSEITWGRKPRE